LKLIKDKKVARRSKISIFFIIGLSSFCFATVLYQLLNKKNDFERMKQKTMPKVQILK